MAFMKISPQPGLFTDGTRYSAEGTWYDADKVRFRKGFAEKIGGWSKYIVATFLGTARKLHEWSTDSGNNYLAFGTHLKLYVNLGGLYYDITPLRTTATLGTDPIATVDGTAVITVTATGHGAVVGDYVTLAGSDALNNITAAEVNTEHRIVALGDPNGASPDDKFRVVCADKAGATDTAAGGTGITAAFQINTGLDVYVEGSGWGSGTWGAGGWGSVDAIGQATQLRLWSLANFGDDLVACARQGDIYYWDESAATLDTDASTATRAVPLSDLTRRTTTLSGSTPIASSSGSTIITVTDKYGHGAGVGDTVTLSGATAVGGLTTGQLNQALTIATTPTKTTFTADVGGSNASSTASGGGASVGAVYNAGVYYAPVAAKQAMMSDVARHLIAFGCNPIGSTTINPLFVRWSTSENAAEWQPLSGNSAGGQELSSGSEIIGALMTRQEILIWTDAGIQSMRYTGSPFYFSFTEAAKGMSIVSPNAAVNAGGTVYFMDRGAFYTYTGTAQRMVCPVLGTVFDDFDDTQSHKVFAASNSDFSEVTWFYPSESGTGEVDKYVTFNYADNVWYTGTLVRGAWSQAATRAYPIASSVRKRTLGSDPITTSSSSGVITITDAGHGLRADDKVIFDGIPTVGGLSTVVLNNQHSVTSITDADTYTITVADLATSSATGGGHSVIGHYPNVLYNHENGHDDDGAAMTAYIETGDMDMGEGDQFWYLHRMIPDIQFRDAGAEDEVTISLNGHNYPGETQAEKATAAVTPSTGEAFIRARARQMSMKVQSTGLGYGWRIGHVRLDGRTDGKR